MLQDGCRSPGNNTRSLPAVARSTWAWYHTLEPATISIMGCMARGGVYEQTVVGCTIGLYVHCVAN